MLIYLIDDDVISLYLAEQVLELAEFAQDVRLFSTAETALSALIAQLPTQVPQVIFLDLNMPGMDGWDFLQALAPYEAALRGRCHIYILTSSLAYADTDRAKDYALVAGMLNKPLDDDALQAITKVLQGANKEESQS